VGQGLAHDAVFTMVVRGQTTPQGREVVLVSRRDSDLARFEVHHPAQQRVFRKSFARGPREGRVKGAATEQGGLHELHLPRDALVEYRTRHYGASSMVLAAAGAVDHDAIVAYANAAFADLPPPHEASQVVLPSGILLDAPH
jgi:hypothetical protein